VLSSRRVSLARGFDLALAFLSTGSLSSSLSMSAHRFFCPYLFRMSSRRSCTQSWHLSGESLPPNRICQWHPLSFWEAVFFTWIAVVVVGVIV
jgi:hypothetical protein